MKRGRSCLRGTVQSKRMVGIRAIVISTILAGLACGTAYADETPIDISCTFESLAATSKAPSFQIEAAPTTFKVELRGLESDQPILGGNMGTARLLLLRRSKAAIWMAEVTGAGNVNIWTYFPLDRIILMTKQYRMIDEPYGQLSVGRCQPLD
jgi:hypothetical protein